MGFGIYVLGRAVMQESSAASAWDGAGGRPPQGSGRNCSAAAIVGVRLCPLPKPTSQLVSIPCSPLRLAVGWASTIRRISPRFVSDVESHSLDRPCRLFKVGHIPQDAHRRASLMDAKTAIRAWEDALWTLGHDVSRFAARLLTSWPRPEAALGQSNPKGKRQRPGRASWGSAEVRADFPCQRFLPMLPPNCSHQGREVSSGSPDLGHLKVRGHGQQQRGTRRTEKRVMHLLDRDDEQGDRRGAVAAPLSNLLHRAAWAGMLAAVSTGEERVGRCCTGPHNFPSSLPPSPYSSIRSCFR
ncbi:hypothetical protein IWX48DRAFT_595981 [Phyllosticta citricarpa]